MDIKRGRKKVLSEDKFNNILSKYVKVEKRFTVLLNEIKTDYNQIGRAHV